MTPGEEIYKSTMDSNILPGIALMAESADGILRYEEAIGVRSVDDSGSPLPMKLDTVMWLASCTKLLTAIAALQCVERGLFTLDEDLRRIHPCIGKYGIFTSNIACPNQLETVANTKIITMRHLLSHTAGYAFPMLDPRIKKWRQAGGITGEYFPTVQDKTGFPMSFEPNASWSYSVGLDLAGKVIELVTGESLETCMTKYIWGPLGITDSSFWPRNREDLITRIAPIANIDLSGAENPTYTTNFGLGPEVVECFGGGGVFGTPRAFFSVLRAVLKEDKRLLRQESWAEFFRPQLQPKPKQSLHQIARANESTRIIFGLNLPAASERDFSFAGLVSMESHPGWVKKGTVMWAGMPSIIWSIDRETGLCTLAAPQVFPPMIPDILKVHSEFQRAMYRMYQAKLTMKCPAYPRSGNWS